MFTINREGIEAYEHEVEGIQFVDEYVEANQEESNSYTLVIEENPIEAHSGGAGRIISPNHPEQEIIEAELAALIAKSNPESSYTLIREEGEIPSHSGGNLST